jgi:hypothetical protein
MDLQMEGCEKVTGGRSEAKTSGRPLSGSHPDGVPDSRVLKPKTLALFQHPTQAARVITKECKTRLEALLKS